MEVLFINHQLNLPDRGGGLKRDFCGRTLHCSIIGWCGRPRSAFVRFGHVVRYLSISDTKEQTMIKKTLPLLLAGSLALAPLTGCESLPGDRETQGAVIGGLGGALAGGLIGGSDNRLLGVLIGGALGAGTGWLIGSQLEKADDRDDARRAVERAQTDPATAAEARAATTADINNDGYVTLDEVIAMERAGLTDAEMIRRLEATGQFFELTPGQEQYLRDQGINNRVVVEMRNINQDVRQQAYARYSDRLDIGQTPVGEPIRLD
jgi:hypothetical protein